MKNKGPLPPTYLLAAIVAMAALHFLLPGIKLLLFPWTLLGFVPLVIGVSLSVAGDRSFKQHQTTIKPFQESSALVTEGVFRLSRNPMYLGMVLILLGIGLFLGSLTPFAVVPILAVLLNVLFIKVEEQMLEEKFGEHWLRYKNEVRRWI